MPETKLKLIEALKRNGEVVAMTGDGVNDAPALKAAHIGVAMGKHGTEVARQSAALVLMDDDLAGMTQAVEIGRNIYDNLKKAIRYIISIHIPIVSVVLFPLLFGWEYVSIFTPVHIIFLELLMGPTCSIVYENEPPEPDIMLRSPRPFSAFFFSPGELAIGLFQGMVVAAVLLIQIYYCIHVQAGEEAARTMTFVTLIMANMMLTLTGRSKDRSVFTTIRYKNWMLPTVLFFTLLLTACILYWQPLREVFLLRSPHSGELLACFLLAFFSVMWTEFGKRR